MKRVALALLVLLMAFTLATSAWAAGPKIIMDGIELRTDVPPYQTAGRTMVPLRVISESMNATVNWDPAAGQVTVLQDRKILVLTIGSKQALVNGETKLLDVPAATIKGRTFVPLRFVSEALGCGVDYRSGIVYITSPDDGSMAYLLKASTAYLDLESMKFSGKIDGKVRVTGSGMSQSENFNMTMDGWFNGQDQVYMEMNVVAAGESESIKMYIDGMKVYMKQGTEPWMVSASPMVQFQDPGLQSTFFTQNPEQIAELVKKLGIRTSFGPDASINSQKCKVVVYGMNKEQFINAINVIIAEFAGTSPELSEMLQDKTMNDMMQEIMNNMVQRLNLSIKIYIAEDSGLMIRQDISLDLAMGGPQLGGGSVDMKFSGAIDFYGYNAPVVAPNVSGAIQAR